VDENDGFDSEDEEPPYIGGPQPQQERKRKRGHGIGHGQLFREEFGFSFKHVGVVALLFLIVAVVFVIHFGTNPTDIVGRIKQQLGVPVAPLAGRVLTDPSVNNLSLRYIEGGQRHVASALLLGLEAPGSCYGEAKSRSVLAHALPPQTLVGVSFNYAYGRQAPNGQLQVVLTSESGRNLNVALLEAGAARVNTAVATSIKQLNSYQQAQAQAQRAHKGFWRQHRCR
jgi:hypothetical protein